MKILKCSVLVTLLTFSLAAPL
jgi:hypothetical protein